MHCDADVLALAALGERISPEDSAHLAECEQCTADLAELIEVVTLAREAPPEVPPAPESVWLGISQELGLGRDSEADPPTRPRDLQSTATVADGSILTSQPVVARSSRTRIVGVAAAAAVVGALLGGTAVYATLKHRAAADSPGTLVAQTVLDPLQPDVTTPGKAQVLETSDGLVVRVDARGLPQRTGFYEVWLLDTDATGLVSLGALPSGAVGTFTIPPGVTLTDFPVVDISLEPDDGNPEHSHDSLMRGTLEA